MKKATITIITSAALAFGMPLYAAEKAGINADSEQKTGVAQQDMKYDSEQKVGVAQQRTDQKQAGPMITAEELKGMEVVSQEGEELGGIEQITIDKQSGEVQFVTLSRGGILGIGSEKVAVPLSAFEFRDDQARLTVDQSKLENVPQQTAEATDSDYLRDLETHYGVAPAWGKGDTADPAQTWKIDQDPTESQKGDTQN